MYFLFTHPFYCSPLQIAIIHGTYPYPPLFMLRIWVVYNSLLIIEVREALSLPLVQKVIRRRKWQPTPVFLPGESQGLWSLVGCRLWGRTESDTTEAT